jgi:hypothetical protein
LPGVKPSDPCSKGEGRERVGRGDGGKGKRVGERERGKGREFQPPVIFGQFKHCGMFV